MQRTAQNRPMRACLLVLTAAPRSVPRKDYAAVFACLQVALLGGHVGHTRVMTIQGPATQKFAEVEARVHDA